MWNRQRKNESLIDVEDVGLGHITAMKWNSPEKWIYPDRPAHPVQWVRTKHPCIFKGLAFRDSCKRRMTGNGVRGEAYYRCRFPREYAIANKLDHPVSVNFREADVVEPLDAWPAQVFAPDQIEATPTALDRAQPDTDHPVVALQEEFRRLRTPPRPAPGSAGGGELVDALGGMRSALRDADPVDKHEVYRQLGLRLVYDHEERVISAETRPKSPVGVLVVSEGGLEPPRP